MTNDYIVYYLRGAFHFEMTFTGGLCSVSRSIVFPHVGQTPPPTPPTSDFSQINNISREKTYHSARPSGAQVTCRVFFKESRI